MPSDITGHAILDAATRELRVVRGPVFTNVLLRMKSIGAREDAERLCRGHAGYQ